MPSYSFAGVQSIASSSASQPVFGTSTTAAASPTYDQFAGNRTGANPSVTTLAVSSTEGFTDGSNILVATTAQLGSANPNVGRVVGIVSTTSMTVSGLNQSVASGAWVILAEEAESITIKPIVGNSAVIYIGTAQTVSSTDASVIDVLPNPTSSTYSFNFFHAETTDKGHAYNTSQYWASGTASDKFVANFTQG
jgi:hypothetical protein